MSWNDYYYESSGPRRVAGGIKAQSKRGSFGTTWWGKRWIQTLEGFPIGARLSRGRSYARGGQVLSLDIEKGQVRAKVQGSRPTPYRVVIHLHEHNTAEWTRIVETVSGQPFFAAKLLAGEIPPDFEQVFEAHHLSLFPAREADLETDCSCPDWSNPCKHVAAVYYLLAEEFDRDPFLLFRLRGLTRDELLARLAVTQPEDERADEDPSLPAPEPILANARFWQAGHLPDDLYGVVRTPPVGAALPKRLGKFPLWRAEESLQEVLESLYPAASRRGLSLFEHDG